MGTFRPVPNVYMPPIGGGQWVKGTKHPYEIVQVGQRLGYRTEVQAKVLEMQYT